MASSPLLVIVGASGQQGGSVLRYFVSLRSRSHGPHSYRIRCIFRNPSHHAGLISELKSNTCSDSDIEIVQADLLDRSSLTHAFDGANYIFAMTTGNDEYQQGVNLVDSLAALPTKPVLVFSTGIDTVSLSDNRYNPVNFTSKFHIQEYIQSNKLNAIFVLPGFFMQNFYTYSKPVEIQEPLEMHTKSNKLDNVKTNNTIKTHVFYAPYRRDLLLPFIDIDDLGRIIHSLIQKSDTYLNKTLYLVGEWLSMNDIAYKYGIVNRVNTRYERVTYEKYCDMFFKGFPSEFVKMYTDMCKYVNEYGYLGGELEVIYKNINDNLTKFQDFVQKQISNKHHSSDAEKSENQRNNGLQLSDDHHNKDRAALGLCTSKGLNFKTISEHCREGEKTLPLSILLLHKYYLFFSSDKEGNPCYPLSDLLDLFEQNAIIRFPYFPLNYNSNENGTSNDEGKLLKGVNEIEKYYEKWYTIFQFESIKFMDYHLIKNAKSGDDGDLESGLVEVHMNGEIRTTKKQYRQVYFGMVTVSKTKGKIVEYKEIINSDVAKQAILS